MRVDVLVIDEVSMISKAMMDKVDLVPKKVRSDGRPFGGIRMLSFGDFLQLPSIVSPRTPDSET